MLSSIPYKSWQNNDLEINKGATIRISYNVTFVNDMSSGTTYGDGFKNGARSMYISRSSGVKWISWRDIPLLETGFTNSLRLCLWNTESLKFSCNGQRSTNTPSSVIVQPSYLIGKRSPLESQGKGLCWKSTFDCRSTNKWLHKQQDRINILFKSTDFSV